MVRYVLAVFVAVISSTTVPAQLPQPTPEPSSGATDPPAYELGSGITPPQLIPALFPTVSGEACKKHVRGKVILNMGVDAHGAPVFSYFVKPLGNGVDRLAISVAEGDRFTPATRGGIAVPARQAVEMTIHACVETINEASGQPAHVFRLEEQPSQSFGSTRPPRVPEIRGAPMLTPGLTPPIILRPEYFDLTAGGDPLAPFEVSVVIDEHGLPHDPTVVSPPDYHLDGAALDALANYRFVPALRNGKPFASRLTLGSPGAIHPAPFNAADHR